MQRSTTLQPLSREHHTALTLAKACERAVQSGDAEIVRQTCQRAVQAYSDGLQAHFQIEEQSLLPLLQSGDEQKLVQRTLTEHQQICVLLDEVKQGDAVALAEFGSLLSAHVRFEERELFPALEDRLD